MSAFVKLLAVGSLLALVPMSLAAAKESPVISPKFDGLYAGTCTPDKVYCAHFAPTEIPVHTIARVLRSAKKSIRIATYNMDVVEFIDLIETKLDEGVKVEFGADFALSFNSNKVWRSLKAHPNLTKFRLPVLRGYNPQMHNKIIIVDNEVLLFGSANFTYSGLVANYENVLEAREKTLIANFNSELDELKANALAACEIFASDNSKCGQGTEKWDEEMEYFLKEGHFQSSVVSQDAKCKRFADGAGVLDQKNLIRKDVQTCVTDAGLKTKLNELAQKIAANERLADGTLTSEAKQNPRDAKSKALEVYFSPEDNVEPAILRELSRTLSEPQKSFVLVSTNFITNRSIAEKLVELHRAGVSLKVFFDRGRAEDPNFQKQIATLKELDLTIFDNSLTGPYGSNHNKFAVVGVGDQLTLLNGSANWSVSAMTRNDENFVVVRDTALAALYAREVLSQLFVYGYAQDPNNAEYNALVSRIAGQIPCVNALMFAGSCVVNGTTWKPANFSSAVFSLQGSDANPETEQVWVWVKQIDETLGIKAIPMFTHEVFAGRWLTAVPLPANWNVDFKFFKAPKGWDPNTQGIPDSGWEYSGHADRQLTTAPSSVHVVREIYSWGRP